MVKFENVEIRYGDFVAINDLNLEINQGEFFTFLGPSGCGKTTSLRALVGFITPSKGKVIVAGKDVTNLPVENRNIGMVFQSNTKHRPFSCIIHMISHLLSKIIVLTNILAFRHIPVRNF